MSRSSLFYPFYADFSDSKTNKQKQAFIWQRGKADLGNEGYLLGISQQLPYSSLTLQDSIND